MSSFPFNVYHLGKGIVIGDHELVIPIDRNNPKEVEIAKAIVKHLNQEKK